MAAALPLAAACALFSSNTVVEHQPDGTYQLTCPGALSDCLRRADDVCAGASYTVLRAADNRDYRGPQGVAETETRTSTAVIRCSARGGPPLFGAGAEKAATPAPPPPPPAVPSPSPSPRDAGRGNLGDASANDPVVPSPRPAGRGPG